MRLKGSYLDDILTDLSMEKTHPGVFEAQIPLLHAILLVDQEKHYETEIINTKRQEKAFEETIRVYSQYYC